LIRYWSTTGHFPHAKPSGEFFYRGPMFVIDGLKTIGCLGSLLEVLKLRRQWPAFWRVTRQRLIRN
jgi:hypothetical protein